METANSNIDHRYEAFYRKRSGLHVYPTEFVVRIFKATYPGLSFRRPAAGERVLDVGFGDGRNTVLLCQEGLDVHGIELSTGIVEQTSERLRKLGLSAELTVGRNSRIPYGDGFFDYILACHCCYYCDEGESLHDNLKEYARVLKPGGFLVASVASQDSYIFEGATELADGSRRIDCDPYGNRNGYRLFPFGDRKGIEAYFSPLFGNFSFGFADNDYFGIREQVFWVVCQKG